MGPAIDAFRSATLVRFTAGGCGAQHNNRATALRKSAGVLLEIARLFSLPTTLSVVPEGGKTPELISELSGSGLLKRSCVSRKPVFGRGDKELARAVQA